jgi:hypothetical protein
VIRLRATASSPLAPAFGKSFPEQAFGSSRDGSHVLFGSIDRSKIVVRDATTFADGTSFATTALGSDRTNTAFALDTTGGRVAGTNSTGRAIVWSADGAVLANLPAPGGVQPTTNASLVGIAFSPDGTRLAVKTIGQRLIVWEIAAKTVVGNISLPTDAAARVVWSPAGPDGSVIAVDGGYLYDAATLTLVSPRLRPKEWSDIADRGSQATRFRIGADGELYMFVERTFDSDAVRWRISRDPVAAASCAIAGRNFTTTEFRQWVGPGVNTREPCYLPAK